MKAIAYVAEREVRGNEQVMTIEEQKDHLRQYSNAMGIEIIAWYEDRGHFNGNALNRPGLSRALASTDDFEVFLVEGIKSLGNIYSDIKPLVNLLVKAGKPILEAKYHWDLVSQKVRKQMKAHEMEIVTQDEETIKVENSNTSLIKNER